MNILWGGLICLVGIFMFFSALRKSEFIIYKLITARSRVLWGDNVHTFYLIVGIILVVFGILVAVNII